MFTILDILLRMEAQASKATAKENKPRNASKSVTLRVRADHIVSLDAIAAKKGIIRSAAIQIAIAEFIERKGK